MYVAYTYIYLLVHIIKERDVYICTYIYMHAHADAYTYMTW